jgi:hypothetical protein
MQNQIPEPPISVLNNRSKDFNYNDTEPDFNAIMSI